MRPLQEMDYMAKTNEESKITKPIEETLWKSVNRLCDAIESSDISTWY